MRYNVAQLLKEGVGATRTYAIEGDLYDIDPLNPGPASVTGEVVLLRIATGILARGAAQMRLTHECRRCLDAVTERMDIEFEEEFVPSMDIETGVRLPPIGESPELVIDERHILDLGELLRQYAVLVQVDGSLCRPDCAGLCSICGSNLNYGSCDCDSERIDPRLEVLTKLLESRDET